MSQTLFSVIEMLVQTAAMLFGLRFLLQATQADFYNPISQFVVKFTGFIAEPLRKIIKPVGRWDIVSLLIMFGIFCGFIYGIAAMQDKSIAAPAMLLWALRETIDSLLWLLMVSAIIEVILSWLGAGVYNSPVAGLVTRINAPLINPIRRLIPSAGGLDFSPMLYLLLIWVLRNLNNNVIGQLLQ